MVLACGLYPREGLVLHQVAYDGLPIWTKADRDLLDRDLVAWYTFGQTHIPTPEDWPVMPTASVGFKLQPDGFFDRNPALDLPLPAR